MTVSSWTSHSFLCRCELRWRRGQWIRVTVKRRIQQKKSRCCSLVESWCRTWISCQSLALWLCGCPTGWRGWRRAGPCWTRSCGSCSWWPGRRWRWSCCHWISSLPLSSASSTLTLHLTLGVLCHHSFKQHQFKLSTNSRPAFPFDWDLGSFKCYRIMSRQRYNHQQETLLANPPKKSLLYDLTLGHFQFSNRTFPSKVRRPKKKRYLTVRLT